MMRTVVGSKAAPAAQTAQSAARRGEDFGSAKIMSHKLREQFAQLQAAPKGRGVWLSQIPSESYT